MGDHTSNLKSNLKTPAGRKSGDFRYTIPMLGDLENLDHTTFSQFGDFIGLGRTKGWIYTIGLFLAIKVLSLR